jgi:hypothetical protein
VQTVVNGGSELLIFDRPRASDRDSVCGPILIETLLGTCANAGTTLVAIIGGFLITRYLGIDSEIRGIYLGTVAEGS